MPYKPVPGGLGRIYVPAPQPETPKKHDCKDCSFCQWCAEERCRLCRSGCAVDGEAGFCLQPFDHALDRVGKLRAMLSR